VKEREVKAVAVVERLYTIPVVIEKEGVALNVTGKIVSALCIALQTPRKVFEPVQMFV
jgi:hypothetical protein